MIFEGCVNVICCDKTGTLTANEMTARNIISSDDIHAEVNRNFLENQTIKIILRWILKVTGKGYAPDGSIKIGDQILRNNSHPSIFKVIEVGAVCNNSHIFENRVHGQPTEAALLTLAIKVYL